MMISFQKERGTNKKTINYSCMLKNVQYTTWMLPMNMAMTVIKRQLCLPDAWPHKTQPKRPSNLMQWLHPQI